MTRTRVFDLCVVGLVAVVLAVPFLAVFAVQMLVMGRPYFYASERMRGPTRAFVLWKLRSMHPDASNGGVSGGDKTARIPRWGRFLRASRLDEVPQLWNVLRGEMRLVGPRPPLRAYVERFPQTYGAVLQVPPGITGLATLTFHRHERRILRACHTAEETDAVYSRRCILRKARIDRIYHDRQCLRLDAAILIWTIDALTRQSRHGFWRKRPPSVPRPRRMQPYERAPGRLAT